MAVIYTKVFASEGTKACLALAAEEYVRPLNIGTNWTSLRLIMLGAIRSNLSGTNNISSATFLTGFCSGTVAPYGAATTQHFAGMLQGGDGGITGTYVYTANSGSPYYNCAVGGYAHAVIRYGTTLALPNFGGASMSIPVADQGLARKMLIGVEVTKGGINSWNFRILRASTAATGVVPNYTFTEMLMLLEENAISNTLLGQAFGWQAINSVVPVDEALHGYLDTVNIYWNKSTNPLEIYAIGVSRLT